MALADFSKLMSLAKDSIAELGAAVFNLLRQAQTSLRIYGRNSRLDRILTSGALLPEIPMKLRSLDLSAKSRAGATSWGGHYSFLVHRKGDLG